MTQCHTVVIIEDDGDLRDLLASLLSQAGYRVSATGDARHGVDVVRQNPPDLVLCDISMPEMDGYAVVRALQSDPATSAIPVAFLTARGEFTDRVRAFRSGVVDYITKPVTAEALLNRVGEILRGSEARSKAREGDASILLGAGPIGMGLVEGEAPRAVAEGDRPHPAENASEPVDPDFGDLPPALREIVIADDDGPFRAALAAVFARCGFQVREAGDGMEAVSRVLERPPSLLLVDVRMPVLDGFEVCRRLRGYALTRHLPIVLLSGFDEVPERAAGLEAGANEFLSKRTSLRELLLRVLLQMQRYARPPGATKPLHGRIDRMGAPSVLQVCLKTALSGTLTATEGSRVISMGFEAGRLMSADSGAARGREAVFEFLTWDHGTFAFADGVSYAGTSVSEPVSELLREGCRRVDGRNRDRAQASLAATGV